MQGNQAPQHVSHLITNCHFSFFTCCMSTITRCILAWVKVQSSYSAVLDGLASQPSSHAAMHAKNTA